MAGPAKAGPEPEMGPGPGFDVDVFGNGQLIMRTTQRGDLGKPSPKTGETVEIEVMKLMVGDDDHPFPSRRSFRLGDGDECDALEVVVKKMVPNEVCAIKSVPAAFGLEASLCKARPAAEVKAMIRLVAVVCKPLVHACCILDRVAEAKKKKQRGNFLFGREEFKAAAYSFSLGLSYIREACHKRVESERCGLTYDDEEVSDDTIVLCGSLYTNLALAELKISENPKAALLTCRAALDLQREDQKALYLKAKALLAIKPVHRDSRNEAITSLEKVLKLDPSNKAAQDLLVVAQETEAAPRTWQEWAWIISVTVLFFAMLPSLGRMLLSDAGQWMNWVTGRPPEELMQWLGLPPAPATDAQGMRDDDIRIPT